MVYKLCRELQGGELVSLRLGVPEVDAYLDFIKHRCRFHTWLNCAYDLQVFLNVVQRPVLEVTAKDVFAFIQRQRETPPFAKPKTSPRHKGSRGLATQETGLSPRTIKRRLATVSGLYEFLRIRGDLAGANPVPRGLPTRSRFWAGEFRGSSGLRPLVRTPRTLPQPLEAEEISRFLGSLRTLRDRAMILLMLVGGLRKGEVVALALEDIDLGKHTVMVREGKGGHQRLVPVSTSALEALLRYLNEERPPSSSGKVFLALKGPRRGQPLSRRTLDLIVQYHRQRAGTPGVQCHRLRHTCFTRLRQAGMSLEALQAQAGHQSIMSTRVYLHLCARELQEEYQRASATLFMPGETEVSHG